VSYSTRTRYDALTITITEAGCDCSYLKWTNPSPHNTATVQVGTP